MPNISINASVLLSQISMLLNSVQDIYARQLSTDNDDEPDVSQKRVITAWAVVGGVIVGSICLACAAFCCLLSVRSQPNPSLNEAFLTNIGRSSDPQMLPTTHTVEEHRDTPILAV